MGIVLKFKGKKRYVGTSYVVTIPEPIAKLLTPRVNYTFTIKEED